jgi:hypothetical protein
MATTTTRTTKVAAKAAPAKATPATAAAPAEKAAAPKPAPVKKAPVKKAAAEKPAAEKVTYSATGRSGRVRTQRSASELKWALDACVAERSAAFAAGCVIGFYSDKAKAEAARDEINGGKYDGWSNAVIVAATVAK